MSDEIKPRFDPESEFEKQKNLVEDGLRKVSDVFVKFINVDDMNNLVRRLGEIGWLDGINQVKREGVAINFSPKGKAKFREIIDLQKTIKPSQGGNHLHLDSIVSFFKSEFDPPLTFGENTALSSLVMEYFIKFELPKLLTMGDAPPAA
jgi:hypothetical protein